MDAKRGNERIIPIQVEVDQPDKQTKEQIIPVHLETHEGQKLPEPEADSEQKLAEPMEKLSLKRKVKVKSAPKVVAPEKVLEKFDVFEEKRQVTIPFNNVPEKIVLVIDRAEDEDFTPFMTNGLAFTPLSMLKRALAIFLKLKMNINKKHEYAVMVLNENNAKVLLDFTADVRKVWNTIDRITECEVEDTFKLNTVFEEVLGLIDVPVCSTPEVPPPYIVRVIMLWGRSYTIPECVPDDSLDTMLSNPYLICDVLMTHEPIDKSNHCDKIFTLLQSTDIKGRSYFFPVGRDTKRLHNCMAKLLAHPLQRPIQKLQKV